MYICIYRKRERKGLRKRVRGKERPGDNEVEKFEQIIYIYIYR